MTFSKPNLLELAKQGNPKAIAHLINRHLQPKGVTTKVALEDGYLQVILEAEQIPKQELVAWVQKGITALESDFIQSVKVCGRQAGGNSIGWVEEFKISEPVSPPSSSGDSKNPISNSKKNLKSANESSSDKIPFWKCTKTLTEESGLVYSIATNSSGKILVNGTGKNTVRVWNLRTNKMLNAFKSSAECVYCVAVSPDGQMYASGGSDTTINIKNLTTGFPVRDLGILFSGHSRYVHSLAFSPNGQLLASGSADKSIKIWDLKTGQIINTLTGHTGCIWSIAISQDSKSLVSGSGDNTIKVWSLTTGSLICTLSGHLDSAHSVAISPDGNIIASGSFDKTIRVWNLNDPNSQTSPLVWASPTGESYIHSVSINSDGKTLASMNGNKVIQLWNLKTGELLQTLTDHASDSWSSGLVAGLIGALGAVPVTVYFGLDEDTLISATNGKIRVWEREPVSLGRTVKYYENLIYDRTNLLSSSNALTKLDEEAAYHLAKFLLSFISADEEFFDTLSVRYKGEKSYLVFTNKRLVCLSPKDLASDSKKLSCSLEKIQNFSLGNNGLSWQYGNSEFRAYFNSEKPNDKVLSAISFVSLKSISNDEFEERYQKSNLLAGWGCLTVLAALVVWGFSSCVGAVSQHQTSTQPQATQQSAPSEPKTSAPSNDRTFLGSGPTGYTLWRGSDGCIYVRNLTEGDLSRMNVSMSEFKQVIKEQTGSRCVFFE